MHKIFESQLDDEQIHLVIREHWFFIFIRLFVIGVVAIIGISGRVLGPTLAPIIFEGDAGAITGLIFHTFWLMLALSTFLVLVFYYLRVNILTNIRLVDVDQIGLFGRNVGELQLENIEDVESKTHGVLATVLGFGDVLVQTSGTERFFELDGIAHPEEVKKTILDLYEKRRKDIEPTLQPNHPENK